MQSCLHRQPRLIRSQHYRSCRCSQCIAIERAPIAQIQKFLIRISPPDLVVGLSFCKLISPPVLPPKRSAKDVRHDDCTTTRGQPHTEAQWIFWCLCLYENIASAYATHYDLLEYVAGRSEGSTRWEVSGRMRDLQFPIEMSRAIPTARLELGAKLLPMRQIRHMNGQ